MGQFWVNTATTDTDLSNLSHAYNGSDSERPCLEPG